MSVPLLDLQRQYATIKNEIDDALMRVVASQRFILGSEVEALERAIAGYVGSKHAIGCASGTDALLLASARVMPRRLEATGYAFQHARLDAALRAVLTKPTAVAG